MRFFKYIDIIPAKPIIDGVEGEFQNGDEIKLRKGSQGSYRFEIFKVAADGSMAPSSITAIEWDKLERLSYDQINKLEESLTKQQLDTKFNDVNTRIDNVNLGITGSISTTQTLLQLNALQDGIYEAQTSGIYANGFTAKPSYLTKFKKTGTVWTLSSEVLVDANGKPVLDPVGVGIPQEKAVANYVGEKAVDILNLDLSGVVTDTFIPEDRSSFTFSLPYGSSSYYYEGSNHKGVKKVFVKSNVAGTVSLGIIQENSLTVAGVIEAKTVSVVVGVNTFNIEDIGFNPSNLALDKFVIGASPITANSLAYQTSTTGSLKVMLLSNGVITNTTQKGCVWVLSHNVPETILGTYPATKSLLEDTVNNQNTYKTVAIPEDRNGIVMSVAGSDLVVYGESGIFYNKDNQFKNFNIYGRAAGLVDVFFVKINNNAASVIGQSQVSAVVGKNTYNRVQISAPADEADKIFIMAGNNESKTPNVIHGALGSVSRPWYSLNKASGVLTTSTSAQRFSFWLEVNQPQNLLVQEVNRLSNIVDNLPTSSGLYDYTTNVPILPSDIFVDTATNSKGTALYKNSMFQKFIGQPLPSVQLVSNNKILDLNDPSYIKDGDVGSIARLLVNKQTVNNKIVYKDVNIRKYNSSNKTGTVTWMSMGDSLTEGGAGYTSSPIFLITQKLQAMGITVQGVGAIQRTSNGITQRYQGQGGWRYRTFTGQESQYASLPVKLSNPTKNVYIEGVDGTINEIKAFNMFLYEATAQDKIDYPQWCFHFVEGSTTENVSYAQNPNLGTYHIFSPSRYFSERGITIPNVISIALGTNEWYLGGFAGWNITKIIDNADWLITRFLQSVPSTTKILVVPCNNMPLTRETEWEEKASLLTSAILKIIEIKKLTYNNIFGLSIFAHGSRQMAYNLEISNIDLTSNNTTKVGTIDADVHILNTNDQGRYDYIQSLSDAILYCMP